MFVQNSVCVKGQKSRDITSEIVKASAESGVKEGICCVSALSEHTGIVSIPEKRQEILEDIRDDLERILPPRTNYRDCCDPELSAGRSRAALLESSKDFIIHEGEVLISGNVYLMPFSDTCECSYTITCC
ncbi:MAG TPA: YjbQ family protein [Candidatus Lachnoclostridium stercorigallinarum]|uniref:YjbQ family protein n=1 Tax=Candidatus Lachnoclostridium stercorigallinarum TaxID=2838634 RepID=A0A9D2GH29_9FIRM|nr:YjbQ family protein [Candidatus Lachnoclostridium stercorigallinarum]